VKISTRIFIGYALVLLIFAVVTFVNYRLTREVNENTEWLRTSEQVIRTSAQLHRGIIDMENAFRGYLLTGNDTILQPYYTGDTVVPRMFTDLRNLVKDAPFQEKKLDSIHSLYETWHDNFSTQMIAFKKEASTSMTDAREYNLILARELRKGVGKNITERIRRVFKEFNDYEYSLRQQRRERLYASTARTSQISVVLIILSFLVSILSAGYITRTIGRRIRDMVDVAGTIAGGNFKVNITDTHRDELTSISKSLDKMAHTLDESFTDLARKNADLNQFAYIVSHDLKAPLRGIENVMAWIKEDLGERLDPQLVQYHQIIEGRVKRMENLINGILEFSRIGRTSKPVERVDVKELLEEIIDSLSPPKSFHFTIADNMPVLETERIYLEQVFTNLISNAIKYHDRPDGHIEITVKEDDKLYTFCVKDDGPGIEPEYHERIFVMFQTLQERDAFESTGVGLTIVKKIMEEKGGTVWVESKPGEGSTFCFTWPRVSQQSNEAAPQKIKPVNISV
jgi:signal transduction histidine kinase